MTTWTLEAVQAFCVARHDAHVRALYRFYDQDGVLLYVGISVAPWARWRAHRRLKPWWRDVTTITLERYWTHEIRDAEKIAIRTERPLYNVLELHDRDDVHTNPKPVDPWWREYARTYSAEMIYQQLLTGEPPSEFGLPDAPTGTDNAEQGPNRDREKLHLSLPKTTSDLQERADRDRRDRYFRVPDTSARPGEGDKENQSLSVPAVPDEVPAGGAQ